MGHNPVLEGRFVSFSSVGSRPTPTTPTPPTNAASIDSSDRPPPRSPCPPPLPPHAILTPRLSLQVRLYQFNRRPWKGNCVGISEVGSVTSGKEGGQYWGRFDV